MKSPAQAKHYELREKLSGLCNSPIPGEAEAARRKLNRLLERHTFEEAFAVTDDLFHTIESPVKEGKSTELFSFEISESDVANFTRWALEQKFNVPTAIRNGKDWTSSVWIGASKEAVPELKRLSALIRTQFTTLWTTLREAADVQDSDRRPFMQGLYDGLMDDPRKPGERVPSRSVPKKKGRGKIKAKATSLAVKPSLTTHPYNLAVALGGRIRMKATLDETKAALEQALAIPDQVAG